MEGRERTTLRFSPESHVGPEDQIESSELRTRAKTRRAVSGDTVSEGITKIAIPSSSDQIPVASVKHFHK